MENSSENNKNKQNIPDEVRKELNQLLDNCKEYLNDYKEDKIKQTFLYVYYAFSERKRKSGEPQYLHPVSAANILLKNMFADEDMVISTLLHDIYDAGQEYNYDSVKYEFGEQVAVIVDNVYKIQRIEARKIDVLDKLDNYRTLLLSLITDMRILLVKLADRLHDMETIDALIPDSQMRLAKETLYIYTPFVNRIGLSNVKWQLEDLSFKIINPQAYNEIAGKLHANREEREEYVEELMRPIRKKLDNDVFFQSTGAKYQIFGRAKHIYSIFNKMINRKKRFEELYDIFALRIVVDTDNPNLCFYVYGIVASVSPPAPETFKDYINQPKKNGYESIHTGVVGIDNKVIEVQIRTKEMHFLSEKGVAAHFRYKSNSVSEKSIFENKNVGSWLNEVRDVFENMNETNFDDMLYSIKRNLFMDEIFILTPTNDYIELPRDSVPLDFAYKVHSDLGDRYIGAKVNSRVVPLDFKLHSGDRVEIISSDNMSPQEEWLKYVVTPRAISYINKYLKEEQNKLEVEGKAIWNKHANTIGLELTEKQFLMLSRSFRYENIENFYIAIAKEDVDIIKIIDYLYHNMHSAEGIVIDVNALEKIKSYKKQFEEKEFNEFVNKKVIIIAGNQPNITNNIINTIILNKFGYINSIVVDTKEGFYKCTLILKMKEENFPELIKYLEILENVEEIKKGE